MSKEEAKKKWYLLNREVILAKKREWYSQNRDAILENAKKYREQNHEQCINRMRDWYHRNKAIVREKQKQSYREHFLENQDKRNNQARTNYNINKKYIVYKYIDKKDNQIAYIGSTLHEKQRLYHRRYSASHPNYFDTLYQKNPERFEYTLITEFDSLKDARNYEKLLIIELHPKFNKTYNKGFFKPEEDE